MMVVHFPVTKGTVEYHITALHNFDCTCGEAEFGSSQSSGSAGDEFLPSEGLRLEGNKKHTGFNDLQIFGFSL